MPNQERRKKQKEKEVQITSKACKMLTSFQKLIEKVKDSVYILSKTKKLQTTMIATLIVDQI